MDVSEMRWAADLGKFTFAGAVVACSYAVTYTSSAETFSDFDTRAIAAFGGTVNAVLLAGTLLFLRRFRTVANALLALIVLAGVTTAHLVHTDLWVDGPAVVILLCAASGFALFVAFRVIDDLAWGGAGLSAAALAGLAVVVAGHSEPRVEPVSGDLSNIREVSLSKTPNLYFISFDALVPRTLLKKYLDVETTGFHDLFDAKFRRFPNLFVNAVLTKPSLYTLLALDPQVYRTQQAAVGDAQTFRPASESAFRRSSQKRLRNHDDPPEHLLREAQGTLRRQLFLFQRQDSLRPAGRGHTPLGLLGVPPVVPSRVVLRFPAARRADRQRGRRRRAAVRDGAPLQAVPRRRIVPLRRLVEARKLQDGLSAPHRRGGGLSGPHRPPRGAGPRRHPPGVRRPRHARFRRHGVRRRSRFLRPGPLRRSGRRLPARCVRGVVRRGGGARLDDRPDAVHAVLRCLSDGEGALVEPRTYALDTRGLPAVLPPEPVVPPYAHFAEFLYE